MSNWRPKRFWTRAEVSQTEAGGFAVTLDGRPVHTPAKAEFVLPTRAMAEAAAAEWDAQEGEVRPETMPVTRSANAAIDKVAHQHAEVADMLAAYGETDLLCYRADAPAELAARQAEVWDPLLDWAEAALGARLVAGTGVIPISQDCEAMARLRAHVHALDPFALAAFHDLVALSGSLVIAFATTQGQIGAETAWHTSRIDETWQEEQWGADEEAAAQSALKQQAFVDAARIFSLVHRD